MLFVRIQSTELFGFVFTWIRKNANTVVEIFTTYCSECNIEGYFTVLFTSVHALSGSNSILQNLSVGLHVRHRQKKTNGQTP